MWDEIKKALAAATKNNLKQEERIKQSWMTEQILKKYSEHHKKILKDIRLAEQKNGY